MGKFEISERGEEGYHSGGTRLVLMIVCIVSTLLVYDWLAYFVLFFLRKGGRASALQVAVCMHGLLAFFPFRMLLP